MAETERREDARNTDEIFNAIQDLNIGASLGYLYVLKAPVKNSSDDLKGRRRILDQALQAQHFTEAAQCAYRSQRCAFDAVRFLNDVLEHGEQATRRFAVSVSQSTGEDENGFQVTDVRLRVRRET